MLKFNLQIPSDGKLNILCLGAHSDDIEIGCGGTILRLLEENENVDVHWVVFAANGTRETEAHKSADLFLEKAKNKIVALNDFRDGFFPYIGAAIKEYFEVIKTKFNPDIIFTHYRSDLHQDHRLISELTWNTFRNHLILEYEIIKYDGDLGNPNFYVYLSEDICRDKVRAILDHFKSQAEKNWFNEDIFYFVLRVRGMESNSFSRYAEAFYCRKGILTVELK